MKSQIVALNLFLFIKITANRTLLQWQKKRELAEERILWLLLSMHFLIATPVRLTFWHNKMGLYNEKWSAVVIEKSNCCVETNFEDSESVYCIFLAFPVWDKQ